MTFPSNLQRRLLPIDERDLPLPPPIPPPRPPPRPPPGRRELVSFLVRTARRGVGHTESELSSDDDSGDNELLQQHIQSMIETDYLQNGDERGTSEVEFILTMTLDRLKKRMKLRKGRGVNHHSVASALHNLGCYYAARRDEDVTKGNAGGGEVPMVAAMSLCSRALTMRRALSQDPNRKTMLETPRSPERDMLALAESLNDQGVLLLCWARQKKHQNDDDDKNEVKRQESAAVERSFRGEKMVIEAKNIFEKIHDYRHPMILQMFRNVAYAKNHNGDRHTCLSLLRDALVRAQLSRNSSMIIEISFDLADVCFPFRHLTTEATEVLCDAYALSDSGGSAGSTLTSSDASSPHPFDSHTLASIGYRLALLKFSRRDYVECRRWLTRSIQSVARAPRPSLLLKMLRNDLNRLLDMNGERLERIRLSKERKERERQAEDERRLIEEKISLGILNPDGSDPVEIERERQERIRVKREEREERVRRRKEEEEEERRREECRMESLLGGGRKRRPRTASVTSSMSRVSDDVSITSSVALEGRRPRTSPLSALARRASPSPSGRRQRRGGSKQQHHQDSPLSRSAWFQGKKIEDKVWERKIYQKEIRGRRLERDEPKAREREMNPTNDHKMFVRSKKMLGPLRTRSTRRPATASPIAKRYSSRNSSRRKPLNNSKSRLSSSNSSRKFSSGRPATASPISKKNGQRIPKSSSSSSSSSSKMKDNKGRTQSATWKRKDKRKNKEKTERTGKKNSIIAATNLFTPHPTSLRENKHDDEQREKNKEGENLAQHILLVSEEEDEEALH